MGSDQALDGVVDDDAQDSTAGIGAGPIEDGSVVGTVDHEVLDDAEVPAADSIVDVLDEQDRQAERYAMDFLLRIIRLRGVKIDRSSFLRRELGRAGVSKEVVAGAVESTPAQAGVSVNDLDVIALRSIVFESKKAAAVSFATGLPGGLALFATVPADVTQYYVHAFRVMQKLVYIYGWQDLLGDLDETDDDTVGRLTLLLAVMLGVGESRARSPSSRTRWSAPRCRSASPPRH